MFKAILIIILLIIIITLSEIFSAIERLNYSIKEISKKEKECKEKLEPERKSYCSVCGKELEGEHKEECSYICLECYQNLKMTSGFFNDIETEVKK